LDDSNVIQWSRNAAFCKLSFSALVRGTWTTLPRKNITQNKYVNNLIATLADLPRSQNKAENDKQASHDSGFHERGCPRSRGENDQDLKCFHGAELFKALIADSSQKGRAKCFARRRNLKAGIHL